MTYRTRVKRCQEMLCHILFNLLTTLAKTKVNLAENKHESIYEQSRSAAHTKSDGPGLNYQFLV